MINYKATPRKLVLICCRLFEWDRDELATIALFWGNETALKSTTATRMLMYAISADMILKGEY